MSIDLTQQRSIALANCKQEPIHTPGVVQSFGMLLVAKTVGTGEGEEGATQVRL